MGLTKQTESKAVFLAVKHFCLWQETKTALAGTVAETVTNPETDEVLTKHGFKWEKVEGRAIKLEQYSREHGKKRYTGFKLHLQDGADLFVLDMPYQSTFLRKFLKLAPNVDWTKPLMLSVFKGKDKDGKPETAMWFQQGGDTVKHYFTKDNPRGMPEATQDPVSREWDFKPQQRWLVEHMINNAVPAIAAAAAAFAPPAPHVDAVEEPEPSGEDFQASDDDLPRSMPRSAPADDPELAAWLQRACLGTKQATQVIGEIADKLHEVSSAVAYDAWKKCGEGTRGNDETIRSLVADLRRAKLQ